MDLGNIGFFYVVYILIFDELMMEESWGNLG